MLQEMPVIDTRTVEKFEWGHNCSVWTLLNNSKLTVMQESMPAHTQDELHYHKESTQFIYMLSGILHVELNGKLIKLEAQQGLEIPQGANHRVLNQSNNDVSFLLISAPGHTNDRVIV